MSGCQAVMTRLRLFPCLLMVMQFVRQLQESKYQEARVGELYYSEDQSLEIDLDMLCQSIQPEYSAEDVLK